MVKIALVLFAILFLIFASLEIPLGAVISFIFVFVCLYVHLKSNNLNSSQKRDSTAVSTGKEARSSFPNDNCLNTVSEKSLDVIVRTDPKAHNPYIFNADYISECRSKFIAFDVETTGLDPMIDRIIEISAVVFEDFVPVKSFSTLINPERKIPAAASAVNGIFDSDVSDAPLESSAISAFCNFVGENALKGDSVLVAHNALFDIKFLLYALSRSGIDADICFQDTLYMAHRWELDIPNKKLGTIAHYYGIEHDNAHRAEDDARVCGEIFVKMLEQHGSDLSAQFESLASTEKELCLWFKNLLRSSDCNTDFLTFSSSSYFSVNCLYTVFKAKPKAKKPYILLPVDFEIPESLDVAPTTKSEGSQFIRVFYSSPDELIVIKDQIIKKYQEVFSSALSYVSQSDRSMKTAAQNIFNQLSV